MPQIYEYDIGAPSWRAQFLSWLCWREMQLLTTTPLQLVLSLSPFVVRRPALAPRRTAAPRCCAGGGGPTDQPTPAPDFSGPESYSSHWEQLLRREYRETADQLREKRAKWSRGRLEASGLAVFGASATPETE